MQAEVGNLNIGVLALKGGVSEHINHIKWLGYNAILVKNYNDLSQIDVLIIPGGESTAISKLLKISKLVRFIYTIYIKGAVTNSSLKLFISTYIVCKYKSYNSKYYSDKTT